MAKRKPWLVARPATSPYLEFRPPRNRAVDRLLISAAAPLAARLGPGPRRLRSQVDHILALAPDCQAMTDTELRRAAQDLRPRFIRNGFARHLVAQSFALAREASRRCLGKAHYPTQLTGGLAMLHGRLAEMATGEGKTVTAALTAATAALAGLPVHVVTVNDYLAERDATELGPVYAALGLTVGCVREPDGMAERQAAYAADITYVTAKELGFDYLRDQLALAEQRGTCRALDRLLGGARPALRLRGLGFALVDEADSVLIDEARTPLIIAVRAGPADAFGYDRALALARSLTPGLDYQLLSGRRVAELTESGRAAVAQAASGLPGVWRYRRAREELAEKALAALFLYARDRDYIVRDGEVQIVDEYTGRVAEGRKWEHGLHQLIEAKEGAEISPRDRTAARITYQSFYRRYARLAGMTGTAAEHRAEFWSVYGLPVVRIPTYRKVRRRALGRRVVPDAAARWRAVAATAQAMSRLGRPVLIGTRSVAASEAISQHLSEAGQAHTVLNARQDADEAHVVAEAGRAARVTVATNMAGRGTDIHLRDGVAQAGGLHVIVTEFHESARIDRQLVGRSARQGDPGSWEAIVSLDDDLFATYAPALTQAARLAGPGRRLLTPLLRRAAQSAATRRHAADRRAVLAQERELIRGLAFAGGED